MSKAAAEAFVNHLWYISDLIAPHCIICPDYGKTLDLETQSYAVSFTSKMLYDIGPQSRKVRRETGDRYWKVKLPGGDAVIATHRTQLNYEYQLIETSDDKKCVMLSMKYAGMLATDELSLIVKALGEDKPVLAPLAGAVFSKDCIVEIAKDRSMAKIDVINMINSSCQGGGQHLDDSNASMAIVAALCASRGMKDESSRANLVGKTFKQYAAAGKRAEIDEVRVYGKYATGGLPIEFLLKNLTDVMDQSQKEYSYTLRQKRAALETQMRTQVHMPATKSSR